MATAVAAVVASTVAAVVVVLTAAAVAVVPTVVAADTGNTTKSKQTEEAPNWEPLLFASCICFLLP
jgi:hypothetical protein